jgi:hypothetical protein
MCWLTRGQSCAGPHAPTSSKKTFASFAILALSAARLSARVFRGLVG